MFMGNLIQYIDLIGVIRINLSFFSIFLIEFFLNCSISWSLTILIIPITAFIAISRWNLAAVTLWTPTGANRVPRKGPSPKTERGINLAIVFIIIGRIWLTMTRIKWVTSTAINDILDYSFWGLSEKDWLQFIVFIPWGTHMLLKIFPQILLLTVVFRWETVRSYEIVTIHTCVFHIIGNKW